MEVIKEGFHVYATCEAGENDYFVNMEYPLIKHNKLHSLLPFKIVEQDEKRTLHYEITGKISFMEWGEKNVINNNICSSILHSFLELFQELEEYMLCLNQVYLRKKYIYIDSKCELYFIYGDVPMGDTIKDIEELFFWIFSVVDYNDKRCMDIMYQIYHGIKKKGISRELILQCLDEDEKCEKKDTPEKKMKTEEKDWRENNIQKQNSLGWDDYTLNQSSGLVSDEYFEKKTENILKNPFQRLRNIFNFRGVILGIFLIGDLFLIAYLGWNIYCRGINTRVTIFFLGSCLLFVILLVLFFFVFSDSVSSISDQDNAFKDELSGNQLYNGDSFRESLSVSHWEGDFSGEKKSIFEELEGYWEQGNETVLLRENRDTMSPVLIKEMDKQIIELKVFPFYIGSMDGLNQLPLKSRAVSRQHAVILKENGEDTYYIEDLESKNGTLVDGIPVLPGVKCQIKDGNCITFGDERWKFQLK